MENSETMTLTTPAENNPQERAERLNSRINANAKVAVEHIGKVGRDLKVMRNERLYIKLGCKTFEDYCNTKTPIGQRQAYNFIRCYEKYGERLAELSTIGITKLALMTALDDEDSDKLIESGDAENMSARELAKRVKELQSKNEQLTLELDEKSKEESTADQLKQQNERLTTELEAIKAVQNKQKERVELLEKQNEELLKRPVEVAVEKPSADDIAKIEKAAAEKAEKAAKKQHNAEIKKLREELEQKAEKERLAAVEKANRDNLAKIEQLESEKAVLQANSKKVPPDSKKERLKFYLEECLRNFNLAYESISAFDESEQSGYKEKLSKFVDKMNETLQ